MEVDVRIMMFVGVEVNMVLQVGVQVKIAIGGLYSNPLSFLRHSTTRGQGDLRRRERWIGSSGAQHALVVFFSHRSSSY